MAEALPALPTLLTNGLENNTIPGITLSNHGPRFNHVFFADDFMLFTKATKEDAYEIIRVLNSYTKALGHRTNLSKSGIIQQELPPTD